MKRWKHTNLSNATVKRFGNPPDSDTVELNSISVLQERIYVKLEQAQSHAVF